MADKQNAPTLEDVAKKAGVSTATVSRCLNTPDRVVEKTKQRVMTIIAELGYTPNFGARAMAAKRTYTIGAIIPTMANAIFAKGMQAFQEELHQNGYNLLIASSAYQPQREEEQIRALIARGADGLLLIGYDRNPEIYQFIKQQNIPFLICWAYDQKTTWPCVGFDNRLAMRALAQKVLEFGHRNIGVISGIIKGNDRAKERVLGIQDAVSDVKYKNANLTIIETNYQIENGANALQELMPIHPTAIICGNDVLAVGALKKAHDLGLNVPKDMSITGFDDIELAQIATPALTTVHIPHRDMGITAAQELLKMVEHKQVSKPIKLEAIIKQRDSLGPVKSQ